MLCALIFFVAVLFEEEFEGSKSLKLKGKRAMSKKLGVASFAVILKFATWIRLRIEIA